MRQPITSEHFYHMIGGSILKNDAIPADQKNEACYQQLKAIIDFGYIAGRDSEGGFQPSEGDVEIVINPKGHLRNGDFKGFLVKGTITCFADIPWESLGWHTDKYGMFGFGVSAAHLARVGARPVTYIPYDYSDIETNGRGHGILDNITAEFIKLYKLVDAYENRYNSKGEDGSRTIDIKHRWSELMNILERDVAAYIKPYDRNLAINDLDYYYLEREWRLLGNVKIIPSQVPMIVVAKGYKERLEDEVPSVRDFKVEELGEKQAKNR